MVPRRATNDSLCPVGPYEKTIEYQAPWVRCDRERDYEQVWAHFSKRYGRSFL